MAKNATAKRIMREAVEAAAEAERLASLRTELKPGRVRRGYNAPTISKGRGIRLRPLEDGVIATERSITKTWKPDWRSSGPGKGTSISMTAECRRAWVHKPADGIYRDAITGVVIRTVEMGEDPITVAPRITLESDEYARAEKAREIAAEAKEARKTAREAERAIKAGEKAMRAGQRAKMREAKSLVGTGANNGITNADCDSYIRVMWEGRGRDISKMPKITAAMRRDARKVLAEKAKRKAAKSK